MSVAERLRLARSEAGWTRQEVGRQAGVDPNMIYQYESGNRNPSTLALRGLAALYNKPVEWFFGENEEEQQAPEPDTERPSIGADRELVMNEASLALRSTGKELSDEAIRSIADFIRFVHEKERRESQSGS